MDNNSGNDRVLGMKSVVDIMIVMILAMAGFISFGDSPAGKSIVGEDNKKVTERKVEAKNVVIMSPQNNDQVSGFVNIRGRARVVNSNLYIRVRDGVTERTVYEKETSTNAVEIGGFGIFEEEIDFSKFTQGRRYIVEAFLKENADSIEKDKTQLSLIYWEK